MIQLPLILNKPKFITTLLILASLFACQQKHISVSQMWIRKPVSATRATAGYMTLVNNSKVELELLKVTSPDFENIELHTMTMSDSIMKMNKVGSFKAMSGQAIVLKPHGNHLMMYGPRRELKQGDFVELTLHFKNLNDMTLPVEVKKDY